MTTRKRRTTLLLAVGLALCALGAAAQLLQPPRRPDALLNGVTSEVIAVLE